WTVQGCRDRIWRDADKRIGVKRRCQGGGSFDLDCMQPDWPANALCETCDSGEQAATSDAHYDVGDGGVLLEDLLRDRGIACNDWFRVKGMKSGPPLIDRSLDSFDCRSDVGSEVDLCPKA